MRRSVALLRMRNSRCIVFCARQAVRIAMFSLNVYNEYFVPLCTKEALWDRLLKPVTVLCHRDREDSEKILVPGRFCWHPFEGVHADWFTSNRVKRQVSLCEVLVYASVTRGNEGDLQILHSIVSKCY